jgi:pyruvate dehydrogenase complex dehydrogenase (E1) component
MAEDQDPRETQEWLEALDSVVEFDGPTGRPSCWRS